MEDSYFEDRGRIFGSADTYLLKYTATDTEDINVNAAEIT